MKTLILIILSFGLFSCFDKNNKKTVVVIQDKSFNKTHSQDAKVKKIAKKSIKKSRIIDKKSWKKPINSKIYRSFSNANQGITFDSVSNMNIFAVASGSVVYSGDNLKSYGFMVILKHKYGFYSHYMFTEKSLVGVGDKVTQGQEIAITGNNKFHFSMKKFTTTINPEKYINF